VLFKAGIGPQAVFQRRQDGSVGAHAPRIVQARFVSQAIDQHAQRRQETLVAEAFQPCSLARFGQ
jgi:hypothetical protein